MQFFHIHYTAAFEYKKGRTIVLILVRTIDVKPYALI